MTGEKALKRIAFYIRKARENRKAAIYFMHKERELHRMATDLEKMADSNDKRIDELEERLEEAVRIMRRVGKSISYGMNDNEIIEASDLRDDAKLFIKRVEEVL